jgi:hypothetical protein
MGFLTAGAAGALEMIARKLKGLRTAATTTGARFGDESRIEQGIKLEDTARFGMRSQLGSSRAFGSTNDIQDIPSITRGGTGTTTPGSNENSESQCMNTTDEV